MRVRAPDLRWSARLTRIVTFALVVNLVAAVGMASGPTPARADNLQDRISAAKQHQRQLQRAIDQNKQNLQSLRNDQQVARSALQTTRDQLDGINADQAAVKVQIHLAADALRRVQARRDTLVAELRQLDYTLTLLQSQIDQGTEDLKAQQRQLAQRLVDAYRSQQTSLLEQVLSSGSFTDILTQASAYLSLGQQDADMAASIAGDQQALDSLRRVTLATRYKTDQLRRDTDAAEADLLAQQSKLQAAQQQMADLEAQTKAIQQQQANAFNRINDTQAKVDAALQQDLDDQAKLQKDVAGMLAEAQRRAEAKARKKELQQQQEQQQGTGSGNGWMEWPVRGIVTQEFGCTGFSWEPPYGDCPHFHQGIDISNAQGTPIHAAMDGVIAYVGWDPSGAFVVIIGHAHGLETIYGHLIPKRLVRVGQFVKAGHEVGLMGNTGHSTGTHLHWAVYISGVPQNPRNYL